MPRFHLALAVTNLTKSISDYSERLQAQPCLVIENTYALWRTEMLNLSITTSEKSGFRHVGWENDNCNGFTSNQDVNGISWETFSFADQLETIKQTWPDTDISSLAEEHNKSHNNLEVKLTRLEKLVEKMQGQLSVEESLAVYEQGTKLAVECEKILQTSEQKIQLLTDKQGTTTAFNTDDN